VRLFEGLLDPAIALSSGPIAEVRGEPLMPAEIAAVAQAVTHRRQEFAAGRAHARRAMAALGIPPAPIPPRADRTPCWPAGITGSITHDATHAAAAVVRLGSGWRAVGIDLEPDDPLDASLVPEVCTADERAWLDGQAADGRGYLARLIFSAKESAFKCQFALTRRMLEFSEVRIALDLATGSFHATLLTPTSALPAGTTIDGRFRRGSSKIETAAALRE
jgi:4'-phosphopantetheinyl transferase EntD